MKRRLCIVLLLCLLACTPAALGAPSGVEWAGGVVTAAKGFDLSDYQVAHLLLAEAFNADFLFITDCPLLDFKVNAIVYDGEDFVVGDALYQVPIFADTMALRITTYLPPLFTDLMISYVGVTGEREAYFVLANLTGEGDEVLLQSVDTALGTP